MDEIVEMQGAGLSIAQPKGVGFKKNKKGYGMSVCEWRRRFEDEEKAQPKAKA